MISGGATSPPRRSIWKKSPSLSDLGGLLEHIPDAALIIDRSRSTVLYVNQSFLNLAASTRSDIIDRPFLDLFQESPGEPVEIGEERIARLLRKNRTPIDIQFQILEVDSSGNWGLVTFKPIQHQLPENWHEILLNGILELAQLAGKGNLQNALEQAVQILHDILGLEIIGIYQAENDYPRLRMLAAFDPNLILPDLLPGSDLSHLSTSQIWYPGRRVSTELYRQGRIKGVSYLATSPLGQEGAWNGLLVVGDRQAQPMDKLIQLASVIGSMVSTAIEHYILVTTQDQVIEQQRQTLALQNILAEYVHEGVILVTPDLKIKGINPVAEVMLGYVEKEVYGQPVENILIGPERLDTALNSALKGVPTPSLGHTNLHRRDGYAFPAIIQTIPIEKDNQVEVILILITDISTEEQNKVRTRQLEQRAVIGEVIQVFAHEVRNPINNISLGLEALAGQLEGDDPKQESISRMLGDCTRISHLMETVLASSRPLESRQERVELNILLRKIVERWRPRFAKVNVSPFTQFEPGTPPVLGDPRALEQVFTNLISNAVDAMAKQNGGTLAVKLSPLNIIPNLPQVEITITDNGPGIPDDIRERIFEPFVSNNPRGTGLGLAITKQIMTAHHGSVQVNTFPGGTVFQVILPAYIDGEK